MKLFSTFNFEIPKILKPNNIKVIMKINPLLFKEKLERIFVNFESVLFLNPNILLSLKIESNTGNNVKVVSTDIIRPSVIIHPKSITGFISLKIKDRKAHIVVNAVYKIGRNIFSVVFMIILAFLKLGFSSLICKNLVLICMFIAIVKISINAIKFEDITVTFQPISPSNPIIDITENIQLDKGIKIQTIFLNTNHNVAIIKARTPTPKIIISFLINDIISSAIMGIPPRYILETPL